MHSKHTKQYSMNCIMMHLNLMVPRLACRVFFFFFGDKGYIQFWRILSPFPLLPLASKMSFVSWLSPRFIDHSHGKRKKAER